MGCDIHGVVERKHNGKWVACKVLQHPDPARDRNYERFAALAGVRGKGPEPKGFPDDASETACMLRDDWGRDGHSHSWLPIAEAAAIFAATQWWAPNQKPDAFPSKEWVEKYPSCHYFDVDSVPDGNEYRLVFWFDN